MKVILTKIWLIVVSYDTVDNKHFYYLQEPQRDIHIALITTLKLPSGINQWVRVKGSATCDRINPNTRGFRSLLCNSTDLQNTPCKVFVHLNGYDYCTEID